MPIYVGTNKIKSIYVGTTKIKKVYCGSTLVWSGEVARYGTVTALSQARNSLAGASNSNYALFAGGQYHSNYGSKVVDAYNSSLTRSGVTLVESAIGAMGASVGAYALFGGGRVSVEASVPHTSVAAFDTSLTRNSLTLHTRTEGGVGISTSNYAILAGGRSVKVNAFNASLTRTMASDLSEYTRGSGTSIGNYFLIPLQSPSDTLNRYTSSTLVKGTNVLLSTSRAPVGAASTSSHALFAGGGSPLSPVNVVDAFNTSLVRTTATSLSSSRTQIEGASTPGYAVFGSGAISEDKGSAAVDVYDTSLVRTNPRAFATSRSHYASAVVGNYILFGGGIIPGGTSNSDRLYSVEAYTY